MKYYISTQADCKKISMDKCKQEGCNGTTSVYWWGLFLDITKSDTWAVSFDDNEIVPYPTVSSLPPGEWTIPDN